MSFETPLLAPRLGPRLTPFRSSTLGYWLFSVFPVPPLSLNVPGSPSADFGARDGVWDDMGSPASGLNGRCGATALRGSFTQTRRPGASGVWNDMKSTAYERNGKRRSNGLTRVVYPNPRSWSEKRGLGRHGENALWTQWKNRSYGLLHRLAISEREAGSGTTVWWTKKPEQQPGEGHLFRSPVSE